MAACTSGRRKMDESVSFGYVVRRLRKSQDLTQEELAAHVGCSRSIIDKIERDERRPSKEFAERLALVFRLAPEERQRFVRLARGESTSENALAIAQPRPYIGAVIGQSGHRTNLPTPGTPCIGRDEAIASAAELLRDEGVRLVTLTGTAGIGKTRLALEVAANVLSDFEDGVWFVELASLRDPALVTHAIAQTLRLKDVAGQRVEEHLVDVLRNKHLLLVLDNFEHVLPSAPIVSMLLKAAPRLKVMATSRTVLHLRGEHEFLVPPLALPDTIQLQSVATLSRYPAVQLFFQRARAMRATFRMTDETARKVAEICRHLDGIPLAIELAAARTRLLTTHVLFERLGSRLSLLTGGPRDLPTRQQTLRWTFDWSYDLLDEPEQALFTRLSVFSGGGTLEAIEAVCETGSPVAVLDLLQSLVANNLVLQTEQEDGMARFAMLETIREYAQDRLVAAGSQHDVRRRHLAYFLEVAEDAAPCLVGSTQIQMLAHLEREHNNFRTALAWAIGQQDGDAALRLGSALWRFWRLHGHGQEGRQWLEQALALQSTVHPTIRAAALIGTASLAHNQVDYTTARALLEESYALYQQVGDRRGTAYALCDLGSAVQSQQDYARARRLCEEGLAIFQTIEDTRGIALAQNHLARILLFYGDIQGAERLCEQSLASFRNLRDTEYIASSLAILGLAALFSGHFQRAALHFSESLHHYRELQNPWGISQSLMHLGWAKLLGTAMDQAAILFRESLAMQRELRDLPIIAYCLEGLGGVAVRSCKHAERGVLLAGTAAALRSRLGIRRHPVEQTIQDQLVAEGRARVGMTEFDALWSEGQHMSVEEAIMVALADAEN
jgi:predicted ATPase/transcriptional regulator with XRE-family HTH domain